MKYQLKFLTALPIFPRSYGKPSQEMRPSSSTMTLFDTFVQSSVPIQNKKEDIVVRDCIYREEKFMRNENFSPSPKAYGRGYNFVK